MDDFNWDSFHIQLKDKYSRGDWFSVPRYLFALTKQRALSKSEYIFLTLLISADNLYTSKQKSWFYCSDKKLYETKLISRTKVMEARQSLIKKKVIECKKGYSNHATEYRILLENYCYRGNHYGRKHKSEETDFLVHCKTELGVETARQ